MEFNNFIKYFQRESGKLSQGNYCICVNSFEKMSYIIIIYTIKGLFYLSLGMSEEI